MKIGLTATAGVDDMKEPPSGYSEIYQGAYDADARLRYMDETGIWAMVLYPNVGGFGAQKFLSLDDPELMLARVLTTTGKQNGHPPIPGDCCQLPRPHFATSMLRCPKCGAVQRWVIEAYCSPVLLSRSVNRYSAISIGIRCGRQQLNVICPSAFTLAQETWKVG